MEKRGLSHVEMIASFALFVGFLLFGLYFFNPLNNQRLFDSTLYYTFDAIEDNATVRSISYGIALQPHVDFASVSISLPRKDIQGEGIYVENSRGERVPSALTPNGDIAFARTDGFFQVRLGEFPYQEAVLPGTPQPVVLGQDFSISTTEEVELMDEWKLRQLAEMYQNTDSYEMLKTQFNIPRRVDFGFRVVFSETEVIEATREIPEGVESFAQTKRMRLTRENGSTAFADITVVVW